MIKIDETFSRADKIEGQEWEALIRATETGNGAGIFKGLSLMYGELTEVRFLKGPFKSESLLVFEDDIGIRVGAGSYISILTFGYQGQGASAFSDFLKAAGFVDFNTINVEPPLILLSNGDRINGFKSGEQIVWEKNKGITNLTSPINAVDSNDFESLKLFSEENPEILTLKNKKGLTPAYVAAEQNNLSFLKFLAEKASETLVGRSRDGVTPSIAAAINGNLECLRFIYEIFPNSLSLADNLSHTPAYYAFSENKIDCFKFIIINCPENLEIREKESGITEMESGRTIPMNCLLENRLEYLYLIQEIAPRSLSMTDNRGSNLAHWAAACDSLEGLKIISAVYPEILFNKNKKGHTPLRNAREKECRKFLKKFQPKTWWQFWK